MTTRRWRLPSLRLLVAAHLAARFAFAQSAPCPPPLCPPASTPSPCSCGTACPVTPCPGEPPDIDLLAEVCPEVPAAVFTRANTGLPILHKERLRLRARTVYRVQIEPTVSLDAALSRLKELPGVVRVDPNYRLHMQQGAISDTGFSSQWGLKRIDAQDAWTALGWPDNPLPGGVAVAVVDTGVQLLNPDLDGLIDAERMNFTVDPADQDVSDVKGHGTAMAGIIAAQINGQGYVGVMPGAKIIPCKMTPGDCAPMSAAIECLDWVAGLADHRQDIAAVNFSFAGPGCSCLLEDVVRELRCKHIPLVAAAGNDPVNNDAEQCPAIPATLPVSNVISVTAVSATDAISAAHGRHSVHVAAPGYGIWIWVPSKKGGANVTAESQEGTSPAAAHVSGLLGLLRAQDAGRTWSALHNLAIASGVTGTTKATYTVSGRRILAYGTGGQGATTCNAQRVRRRLRPLESTIIQSAPAPLSITAIDVTCASGTATTVPVEVWTVKTGAAKTHSTFDFQLNDDGNNPDDVLGDGEFAATWTPPLAQTNYELRPWGLTDDVLRVKVK